MRKTTHLNANQIDAVLMGSASRRAKTHLDGCEECGLRVANAVAPLESFRAVAVAWSERKSATMPTSLNAGLAGRGSVRQPLAWSAAALALFAVGLFTTMSMPGTRVPDAARVVSGKSLSASGASGQGARYSMTAEDLASDNQMLSEIDRELGTSARASSTPGLKDASIEGRDAANQVED